MGIKFKKTYTFAFKSALYIALFFIITFGTFNYYVLHIPYWAVAITVFLLFVFCFFVIQFRVEYFIYRRIKKIYDDVRLLENSSFRDKIVTTDLKTLTKEVKKFARHKKIEIETLKVREEYRREFLGNVSHELKTPLFTIQGYLSILLDDENDKETTKRYLQRAEKGVERLLYIVKDLDMIAKLESGAINIELTSFDIIEVVQNVFDLLEMRAQKKNITLAFDVLYTQPISVVADKEKIQQVITNLVVNSIKYGKKDGTTEISIEDLVNNKIIVRVTDNGEGIKQKHITRLFERFYRVDQSGSRNVGGSGLGLSIVKHIIESHKEKIYVESQYKIGSEFSFTLEKGK